MSVESLQIYYSNLLIMQYIGKTKARDTINLIAGGAVMDELPSQIEAAFNIDTAVGEQLDFIGDYIGLSREGFDFSGPITLTDDNYRLALQLKTIQNTSGSSLADIQNSLAVFFTDQIFIFDYLDMRLGYFIDTTVGDSTLIEFFVTGDLLPRPMGVQLSSIIYVPDLDGFYGYRTFDEDTPNNSPLNSYAAYEMDRPYLSYNDAVTL